MQIPCISCQSRFRLDNNLVKATGSLVRCSKCKSIFRVYPPTPDDGSMVKHTKIDQPILDNSVKVRQEIRYPSILNQNSKEINKHRIDDIASIGAFEEEEEDPEIEDIDLTELTQIP